MDGTENAGTQVGQESVQERSIHNSVWSHTQDLVFPRDKVPISLLSGFPQGVREITSWSVHPPAPGTISAKDIKDGKRQNQVLPMSSVSRLLWLTWLLRLSQNAVHATGEGILSWVWIRLPCLHFHRRISLFPCSYFFQEQEKFI